MNCSKFENLSMKLSSIKIKLCTRQRENVEIQREMHIKIQLYYFCMYMYIKIQYVYQNVCSRIASYTHRQGMEVCALNKNFVVTPHLLHFFTFNVSQYTHYKKSHAHTIYKLTIMTGYIPTFTHTHKQKTFLHNITASHAIHPF